MIKDNNYIVIQGWMRDLGLSGNKLMVFAIIYGFSQDENSMYSGTASYIADWLGVRKHTVLDILKELTANGLLEKVEKNVNGIKLCDYRIPTQVVRKSTEGGAKTAPGGGAKTAPHNTSIDNTRDNNPPNNNKLLLSPQGENKKPYGELQLVFLTDKEYAKLKGVYGESLNDAIDFLDAYIGSNKKLEKKYTSHYAVFKRGGWVYQKIFGVNKHPFARNEEITAFVQNWRIVAQRTKEYIKEGFPFAMSVVPVESEVDIESLLPKAKSVLLATIERIKQKKGTPFVSIESTNMDNCWVFAMTMFLRKWRKSKLLRGELDKYSNYRPDAQFFLRNIEKIADPYEDCFLDK